MTTRAALFDLDGTLADTVGLICRLIAETLTDAGFPTAPEAARPSIGRPLEVILTGLSGVEAGEALIAEVSADYRARLAAAFASEPDRLVFPGVRPMLDALQGAGIAVGVVTAKMTDSAEHLLGIIGVRDLVDAVVGTDQVSRGKPAPDSALLALERLGATPAEAWYVGDATSDVEMARAAGMPAIGITTGAGTRAELEASGALAVVDDPAEVTRLILG